MIYRLKFTNESQTLVNVRKILLLSAIALDVANIFMLLEAVFGSLLWLVGVFALLSASCAARFYSRRLIYSFDYEFSGGVLTISKNIPYKSKIILSLSCQSDDFELNKIVETDFESLKYQKDLTVASVFGCEMDYYMLKFSGKKYLVCFDDYLYAIIDEARENNAGKNLSR